MKKTIGWFAPDKAEIALSRFLWSTKKLFGVALLFVSLSTETQTSISPLLIETDAYALWAGVSGLLLILGSKDRILTFVNCLPLLVYALATVDMSHTPLKSDVILILFVINSVILLILSPQSSYKSPK